MTATEHGLANGHEICNCVVSIAYKLYAFSMGVTEVCVIGAGTSCRLFAIRAWSCQYSASLGRGPLGPRI